MGEISDFSAKLGSTEIVRSESSEEEDRESVESDNDDSKENNPLAKDQQTPKANEGEEGEFQTIGIKVRKKWLKMNGK